MIVVAAVQTEPDFGDVAGNIKRGAELASTAFDNGARLVVLPEASTTGYVFADRAEAAKYAEEVPSGQACQEWTRLCAERDAWLVAGMIERAGDKIYNSAVLIGPSGYVGTFRKVHLWNDEKEIYDPGDLGFPVFETEIGRIGMLICYDGWFPESFRSCALAGADIICSPSNWVPVPHQPPDQRAMANLMCMTAAHSNQVYVVAASRVGIERGQPFIGQSMVVDHSGWPLTGPASTDREEILYATVDAIGSRAEREGNPFNQPLRDRRPTAYRS